MTLLFNNFVLLIGQPIQLEMHRKCQPKDNTFFVSKILPTKFTHYLFKPREVTILRRDNTEMYKKERTTETKEALVRNRPV